MTSSTAVELVTTVTGGDYERAVDTANTRGGSTRAVAEHLLNLGQDQRPAGMHTTVAELERSHRQLHDVEYDGDTYWLQIDHHEGVYALYRRTDAGRDASPEDDPISTERTITVDLTIDNFYPDETIQTFVLSAVVAAPPQSLAEDDLQDWAADELFAFTGTGRTTGDSSYDVTVTGSSEAALLGRCFEFG
ncbi:hypothetical protein C8K30_1011041 [Promicromonospora sp. AC04]|uniref:hypothetical protein n=1 Tax=Promicromonospora sp. AC04 TaxID=2135723 RepID=UPI000D3D901D|nr:hypothetical protein [Promicromonospora sp. AC04]PUB32515.1 hypothetical protein C8K30_1011041 [Promicromonospora sp. AC04]